jgi:RNA polymerase sigma-70 factor (ECF subfamily)
LDHLLREIYKQSYSRLFASLYQRFNDFELVEDGIQDAFEKAMVKWRDPPDNPAAWLYTAAKNRILDQIKRPGRDAAMFDEQFHGNSGEYLPAEVQLDEQLRLMCFCCHPALGERVRILLTLKLVAGLTTDEIGAALVMKSKTVGQALTRAKKKIAKAGIPFKSPDLLDLSQRIPEIQKILYLMFNEGYHSNSDHSLYRVDLCNEAIRLARILTEPPNRDYSTKPLLALMLFQHSRSKARMSPSGEPVLLKDQNRKLWNQDMIAEGRQILKELEEKNVSTQGPYYYQAVIAREYAIPDDFSKSDWVKICLTYEKYYYAHPDPIVLLSWISAESYRSNAKNALALIERSGLERHLREYRWFYSVRAELHARIGDHTAAVADIERSLTLTGNPGERRYLHRRLRELGGHKSIRSPE